MHHDRPTSIRSRGTIFRREDQWPEFKFTLPELQYPERLNCVTEFVDKWVDGGRGRPHRDHVADRDADLRAARRAHQPHRQCADPRSRHGAGQSRSAARAELADGDCVPIWRSIKAGGVMVATMPLLRAKEIVLRGDEGEDQTRAVRRAALRRDGEDQAARADLERMVYWGKDGAIARSPDGRSRATRTSPPATPRATTSA